MTKSFSRFFLVFACFAMPIGSPAKAGYVWEQVGLLQGLRCGNYCDMTEHKGGLVVGDSSNGTEATGDFWISHASSLKSFFSRPRIAIPRVLMEGFEDSRGQKASYVRTMGIASDGQNLHALLHVGATYGSPKGYDYVPAYAVSSNNGRTWRYEGPVSVEGRMAWPIFSSSMAYVVKDGVHFMVQDGRGYGFGGLVAFRSTNGHDWKKYGGDITAFEGDKPVFPDLIVHDGRFHLVYENGWRHDGHKVRHLSSDDMLTWRVESEEIAPSNYKSVNIFSYNGELYGHVHGRLWRARVEASSSNKPIKDEVKKPTLPPAQKPVDDPIMAPIKEPAKDPVNKPVETKKPSVEFPRGNVVNPGFDYQPPAKKPMPPAQLNTSFDVPKADVSGNMVTISWKAVVGQAYALKLVGPKTDFRKITGATVVFNDLPKGSYKARLRRIGGVYRDVHFQIR